MQGRENEHLALSTDKHSRNLFEPLFFTAQRSSKSDLQHRKSLEHCKPLVMCSISVLCVCFVSTIIVLLICIKLQIFRAKHPILITFIYIDARNREILQFF